MSPSKRIIINVVASYGRSLFALTCGLFTARWALMALGEIDYGLYGLIGGLTAFVSFLNSLLSVSVSRFYAYSVGNALQPGSQAQGLEECRKWFNTALVIHTIVPLVLILIGYPLGEWAVRSFLTIPIDRVSAYVWVWRMSCISCFVGMIAVPYSAMYSAKQEIAELTIYSFVTTALNVCVLYYMVSHPSDWIVRYALWMMLMNAVPQMIIMWRASNKYPECKVVKKYLFLKDYFVQICKFSGYRLLNSIAMIFSSQGQAIVVNKYLGPIGNAAITVGNSVAAHAQNLSTAIAGAFNPAITQAAGEGNWEAMRNLAYRTCKFGALAVLVFMIPLCFEIHEVMRIWLKTPPEFAAELCLCVLMVSVMEKLTDGHWISIFAVGDIGGYQLVVALSGFAAVLLGWLFVSIGLGIVGVGIALIVAKGLAMIIRFHFARRVAGLSFGVWFKSVLCPILVCVCASSIGGIIAHSMIESTMTRLFTTVFVCEIIFLPMTVSFALTKEERQYLAVRIKSRLPLRNVQR